MGDSPGVCRTSRSARPVPAPIAPQAAEYLHEHEHEDVLTSTLGTTQQATMHSSLTSTVLHGAPVDCTVKMKCSLSLRTCRLSSRSSSPSSFRSCVTSNTDTHQRKHIADGYCSASAFRQPMWLLRMLTGQRGINIAVGSVSDQHYHALTFSRWCSLPRVFTTVSFRLEPDSMMRNNGVCPSLTSCSEGAHSCMSSSARSSVMSCGQVRRTNGLASHCCITGSGHEHRYCMLAEHVSYTCSRQANAGRSWHTFSSTTSGSSRYQAVATGDHLAWSAPRPAESRWCTLRTRNSIL